MDLADLALARNDLAATLAYNVEFVKPRQAILQDRPTSLKAKRDLSDHEMRLGDVAYYAGQHERALALYQDALKWSEQVMWSEPDGPYNRDPALAAIKEGAAKGYRKFVYLESDPDMEPLHALPEFRQWLAEFKKGLMLK